MLNYPINIFINYKLFNFFLVNYKQFKLNAKKFDVKVQIYTLTQIRQGTMCLTSQDINKNLSK